MKSIFYSLIHSITHSPLVWYRSRQLSLFGVQGHQSVANDGFLGEIYFKIVVLVAFGTLQDDIGGSGKILRDGFSIYQKIFARFHPPRLVRYAAQRKDVYKRQVYETAIKGVPCKTIRSLLNLTPALFWSER